MGLTLVLVTFPNEESAKKALRDSRCDGIMIGRGLMGNPWLINRLSKKLFGIELENDWANNKLNVLNDHIEGIYSFYGSKLGNLKSRKHIKWYLENFRVPLGLQREILCCTEKNRLFRLINIVKKYQR